VIALTVTTSAGATQASAGLTVTGTSGSLSHSIPATLIVGAPGASWKINTVGSSGAQNNSLRVGPGRHDGVARLYVGTVDTGRVLEFSWSGTAWGGPIDIGGSPAHREIHNLTTGPGRNDGIARVYACSLDGNLYELSYLGPGWAQLTVGTTGSECTHAAVGAGRTDGVDRVYETKDSGLYELTWNGSGWSETLIGTVPLGITHGVVIGDGRGDGRNHVYVANTASGTYEATYSSGAWTFMSMGDSGDVRNVSLGAGRNDGVARVYASTAGGVVEEFTWSGTRWTFGNINSPIPTTLVHAYVAVVRGDGLNRVYASGGDGNAYEFGWNGTTWTASTLGGGSGYMYGFHIGIGRNDGVTRLYGASFNRGVYEYTWGP
jgi:hypothetical protein